MVKRRLHPKQFFTKEEKDRIIRLIRDAESKTSGEIRVYLEHKSKDELMSRAKKVFEKIGMTKTKHRNGVLIYFSLHERSFAILGDKGIHEKVRDNFWKDIVSKMQVSFSRDDFAGGLEAGIQEIGKNLKAYFPRETEDINELPDEIS